METTVFVVKRVNLSPSKAAINDTNLFGIVKIFGSKRSALIRAYEENVEHILGARVKNYSTWNDCEKDNVYTFDCVRALQMQNCDDECTRDAYPGNALHRCHCKDCISQTCKCYCNDCAEPVAQKQISEDSVLACQLLSHRDLSVFPCISEEHTDEVIENLVLNTAKQIYETYTKKIAFAYSYCKVQECDLS